MHIDHAVFFVGIVSVREPYIDISGLDNLGFEILNPFNSARGYLRKGLRIGNKAAKNYRNA